METTGLDWNDLPLVLTLEQVARVLQTGRTATYEAYRRGRLPGFKIGRRLRFAREAIRRAVGGEEPTEEAAHTLAAAGGGR